MWNACRLNNLISQLSYNILKFLKKTYHNTDKSMKVYNSHLTYIMWSISSIFLSAWFASSSSSTIAMEICM